MHSSRHESMVAAINKTVTRPAADKLQPTTEAVDEQLENKPLVINQEQNCFEAPILTAQDYINDVEYGPMYVYLTQE